MYWLLKHSSKDEHCLLKSNQHLVELLGRIFVIAVLCSSSLAIAGPVDNASYSETLNWLEDDNTTIDDDALLSINGKGAETTRLESDSKFAIILWDEGSQGNKGNTNHEMSSSPVITLTVIHK
jgi:hypothetical protein